MKTTIRKVWRPGSLQAADAVAEAIAAKDLNNLYQTSCYFASAERYRAFCAFYAIMRVVDDRIDKFLVRKNFSADDRQAEIGILRAWYNLVSACLDGRSLSAREIARSNHHHTTELLAAFSEAAKLFPVPSVLWDNFFSSMQRDLERHQFGTYSEFVDYAQGAAVAPTTIYLYLIAAERDGEDRAYHVPEYFDFMRCGRDLALFAYITHILRDFQKDLSAGNQGLLYIAADDMATHGVTEQLLFSDLASGTASPPLRALARELVHRARTLLGRGRACLHALQGNLSPDRAFILELIVQIYEKIIEKIVSCSYDLIPGHHILTEAEMEKIALEVLARSNPNQCS